MLVIHKVLTTLFVLLTVKGVLSVGYSLNVWGGGVVLFFLLLRPPNYSNKMI